MSLSALPLPSGDSTCPPRHQKMSDLNYPQRSPAHPLWWTHCPAKALLELGSSLIYLHGSHPGSSSGVGPGGPCGRKPDKQEQMVKRAVKGPSAAPTPPPKHTPDHSPQLQHYPPVLSGASGVARFIRIARVLGLGVHGVGTPCLVALQGRGLGPLGGPHSHLLQHRLLQAKRDL